MNILIYAHSFPPNIGGAESLVMFLAEGLSESSTEKCKVNVTVSTLTPSNGFEDKKLPFRIVRRASTKQLLKLIEEADLVHIAGPCFLPLILALIRRKPFIVEHHNFQSVCPNGQLFHKPSGMPCSGHFMAGNHLECLKCNTELGSITSLKMWLLTFVRRRLCFWTDRNITITRWLDTVLKLPRTTTIYCGTTDIPTVEISTEHNLPLVFGYIGRLVRTKGVHVLLDAVHRLKKRGLNFHVKIIGDGIERKNLELQSKNLMIEDRVTFMGYVADASVEEALRDAPVIVMPSLNGETFGYVAAEAMMSGRLVIVSNVGALSDVVGDAGLKFKTGDGEALASQMEQVLKDPNLLNNLRISARSRALQFFKKERMVKDHLLLYGELIQCKD